MKTILFFSLTALALAAGCSMAPKYERPKAPVPTAWPSGPAYGNADPAALSAIPSLDWREYFTDKQLQTFIERALTNNRDLRLAVLNVEQARALYGVQRTELYPTVNATGAAGRQRVARDFSGTGDPRTYNTFSVNLGATSWELDFFGRIRSLKAEALQKYLASEQAHRSAKTLIVSSVAQAYMALVADKEVLALAQTTLEAQRSSYNLVKRRHDLGLDPDIDLYRAQIPVDTARRDVAAFTTQVAQDENALNLLLGLTGAVDWAGVPGKLSALTPIKEIGAGLSSEVLLRRPDVLQAEALLKAANADIGSARANFFPRISLTAAVGYASTDLNTLFKAGSGEWSYAPQVVLPIFDARTWQAHRAVKSYRDIAVVQYEKAVQTAFREVADALAVRGTADRQAEAQESLAAAASETYRLANSLHSKGLVSYLNVLDAQRTLFAAQQQLAQVRLQKLANQARLYSVLGGGADCADTPRAGSLAQAKQQR
jgi:multidrug efflux system outer membrane protein